MSHKIPYIGEVTAGMERSGKTYYTEKLGNAFNRKGRTIIAYNVGREEDFKDYENVDFLGSKQTAILIKSRYGKEKYKQYMMYKSILFFSYKNRLYRTKDFNTVLGGKKIKVERFFNRQDEKAFFQCVYKFISNAHLIGDDFRAVTRYGLPESVLELFSRKAHTGKKSSTAKFKGKGVHLSLLYHSLDFVSEEIFTYSTHINIFPLEVPPNVRFLKNNNFLYSSIHKMYKQISDEKARDEKNGIENYNFAQINVRKRQCYIVKGEKIKQI